MCPERVRITGKEGSEGIDAQVTKKGALHQTLTDGDNFVGVTSDGELKTQSDFTTNELLGEILEQLKINNAHLSMLTGDHLTVEESGEDLT